ncbi:MAG: MarR family transcriptional regulator [Proteobacteria bacterium]|nr:MarR family transcriptional regulator [Pseudomonadota bacterium]
MATRSKRGGARAPEPDSPGAAAARLDLGPLPELIGYALRRAQLAVFHDFLQTMAALDIRPAQFSVLLLIDVNPGVSQTAISEALGIKTANLAVMLNELEARGYAKRRPGTTDRRSHALHLTVPGKALLRQLNERVADHEQRLVARLGPGDKAQLLKLLTKLT